MSVLFIRTPEFDEYAASTTVWLNGYAYTSVTFDAPTGRKILGLKDVGGYVCGASFTDTQVSCTIVNWNSSSRRQIAGGVTMLLEK